ncbi:sulfatase family protein [Roseisolibacter agri]|uniref:Arylsulfatase n=1 Tax=Roseisolibacter agri TaxID=2014610 RepID=A0AA37QGJ3_9BACT|nr:sulfatase [Roseisolibacter agri]GLC26388.1 arylsulfatase [Roseisolibacter agri]
MLRPVVPILRAAVLALLVVASAARPTSAAAQASASRPNIVVVFTDDLGYGDLSSYGHPSIRTPHIDGLGAQGVRLTSFYAAASVCTPSRAALLTGRYAARTGLTRVLFPSADTGFAASEVTMAEALRARGYRTAAVGKWHLGARARFLPTAHGFDTFFGVPYSNDMDAAQGYAPLPLLRDTSIVEQPTDQSTHTTRFTDEAIRVVRESRGRPFFVYLAYTMPHVPLHPSAAFRGRSRAGAYGDVIEELDANVGRLLAALRQAGVERNTIVVFTSDNGPWQSIPKAHVANGMQPWDGGSAGPFRGAKFSTYEGGFRVPAVVRWPARIPAGRTSGELATTMDLYTTLLRAAGARVPGDRVVDGHDILPMLAGRGPTPTTELFYMWNDSVEAVRDVRWKLRLTNRGRAGVAAGAAPVPELYDLDVDPGERYDVAEQHPEIVARLRARIAAFVRELGTRGPATS